MKTLKETDYHKTTDLLICCVLIYFDHILEAVEKRNQQRCTFIIKRTQFTDEIIEHFYKGVLQVEPVQFNHIQKNVKTRLYN